MTERLSIALLSHNAEAHAPTGAEHSLALLAEGLGERGHRVAVVVPGPWALESRLRGRGVGVETVPSRACWMTYWDERPWPVALYKWARCLGRRNDVARLAAFLRRWVPDVVHVNCLPHLAGAEAARRCGRPVVWHVREILPPGTRRRWLAGRLRQSADLVVAVSEAVARWVREEGLGERVQVVHNGVEPEPERPDMAAARRALGIDAEGVVIGLFGQLVPHKGALAFIEAARHAGSADADLRFVLAGAGRARFRGRCESAIRRSGLGRRFRMLPPQPTGRELIAASDVVCLATTTPDPFPRAVLEAMAAGRPVAAFDSGGTGEMVVHGETGLLVPVGDVASLAAALGRLGAHRALREAMGRAAAIRARDVFSLERHVARMEALLVGAGRGGDRE